MRKDLKNLTVKELETIISEFTEKKFQAKSIFTWVQQKGVQEIDEMTSLSKELRQKLKDEGYYITNLKVVKNLKDPDGTVKYLFGLSDNNKIETVLLDDEGRKTLCVSSQVGCKMDCVFCATAKLGFKRNLTSAEIIDQVVQAERLSGSKINNIVYMGMGEPLDNYEAVLKSIHILNDANGKNIGARHITISTCGLVPGIEKLAKEEMQIRLAISLHAHANAIRNTLMPINKRYPVEELISNIKYYQKTSGRRVTFEYILLAGINDGREQARGLLNLITGIHCNINLIEYNPHSGCDFKASPKKDMKEFRWIVEDRGFDVVLRYKRGQEIKAACGQLGAQQYNRE